MKADASLGDIIMYATNKEELEKTTVAVIQRIKDAGTTLNEDKYKFGQDQIPWSHAHRTWFGARCKENGGH